MNEINLTDGQNEAAKKIREWMKIPIRDGDISTKVFLLTGKAGTGKTTILQHVFKDLIENKRSLRFMSYDIAGVCFSHKAKEVLKERIPNVFTFASFFKLEIKYLDSGEIYFSIPSKNKDSLRPCKSPYTVVVHDECSVYNYEMTVAAINDSHPNTKVVFVGDRGQLPPINRDRIDLDSPIFDLELEDYSKAELTERVRQTEGNPIIDFSDYIYNQIFGNQDIVDVVSFIRSNCKTIEGKGLEMLPYQALISMYKNIDPKDVFNFKILSYTRDSIKSINDDIIKLKYNLNEKNKYFENQNIIMNSTLEGDNFTLYNSEEFIIDKISDSNISGFKTNLLFVKKEGALCYMHIPKKEEIMRVDAHLKTLLYDALNEKDIYIKKEKWKTYHSFKDLFGDISPSYGLTVYKAQGSTYKSVAVNLENILGCQALNEKRKLQSLYTSITRASENVYFITN